VNQCSVASGRFRRQATDFRAIPPNRHPRGDRMRLKEFVNPRLSLVMVVTGADDSELAIIRA
jgi:hypothetical protein